MQDTREKLKDDIETTENRAVSMTRDLGNLIFSESNTSQAVRLMKAYDPDFELMDLYNESSEIFVDMFNAYLRADLPYLEKFSGEAALAVMKTMFKLRVTEGWEPECKEVIHINFPTYQGSKVLNGRPMFTFTYQI